MTAIARETSGGVPQLRLVRGEFRAGTTWRSVAQAVVACTNELARQLQQQRWVRVDEVLHERRELLTGLERLPLDADGRRCLQALQQAVSESEDAVARMMGRNSLAD